MRLAVVSHKLCWRAPESPEQFQTDGGFPAQIEAISELFSETRLVVPCSYTKQHEGTSPLVGLNLSVVPLSVPSGSDLKRKLHLPFWLVRNWIKIWSEVREADAIHTPIPGDVGTIGMVLGLALRKPLFVRYCGNWFVRRTAAEVFWRWMMERFAGGRNVMLATGGAGSPPSSKNENIQWIFSTSLKLGVIEENAPGELPKDGRLALITVSRQEKGKGTDIVLRAFARLLEDHPRATLNIVGDGAFLPELRSIAEKLGLGGRAVFHGKVEPKQVLALLKQSHVFCYPTESEGFPKVVLEALACGLPVITTRVSVLPQLIKSDCGIILEEPTADGLAAAVSKLCRDPKKYRSMSQAAIAVARNYTLETWRESIGETLRRQWNVKSLSDRARRSLLNEDLLYRRHPGPWRG